MTEKRRIAVIGSNSFSGSDFIDLLLDDEGNDVIGISRSPEKSALYLPYKGREAPSFRFHQLDLNRDMARIIGVLDDFQPEYVVNFAAQSEVSPSWAHPDHWFKTNVVALAQLANALKDRVYLRRYVHISSPEVYGTCQGRITESAPLDPSTPYAASKAAADLFLFTLVKSCSFPLVMVRATNVYGAHQQLWKIIPRAAVYLRMGRRVPLHGGGAAVKSYIHVRDVSRGELLAMEQDLPGSIFHLSPERGYSVRDVVGLVCERMGRDFADSTEVVGERLGQDAAYVIDSTRAREGLGWVPSVSIDDGLGQIIKWVDENWDQIKEESLEYIHRP